MESEKILKSSGDLHLHTRNSDGSLDLEHVVYLAAKTKLGYISITDHDFLYDYFELEKLETKYKIKLIYGVELSCMDYKRNRKVHILCYNPKNLDVLKPYCEEVTKSRTMASEKFVDLIKNKYNFVPELIEKYRSNNGCIFETNILHALAECGYSNKVCGELYNEVFKKEEKLIFKHNDVIEILSAIKKAQGKSVLAHPSVHNSFELLDELVVDKKIDGVEVWHPKNSKIEREKLYNIAITNNLIATGGTDFHGLYNSYVIKIGECLTPKNYIERILN